MIGFISEKLLIPILDFFYGLVPSYGLAIVALTVVIRIALFPLSAGFYPKRKKDEDCTTCDAKKASRNKI